MLDDIVEKAAHSLGKNEWPSDALDLPLRRGFGQSGGQPLFNETTDFTRFERIEQRRYSNLHAAIYAAHYRDDKIAGIVAASRDEQHLSCFWAWQCGPDLQRSALNPSIAWAQAMFSILRSINGLAPSQRRGFNLIHSRGFENITGVALALNPLAIDELSESDPGSEAIATLALDSYRLAVPMHQQIDVLRIVLYPAVGIEGDVIFDYEFKGRPHALYDATLSTL